MDPFPPVMQPDSLAERSQMALSLGGHIVIALQQHERVDDRDRADAQCDQKEGESRRIGGGLGDGRVQEVDSVARAG
jgi:hypothetical protein